MLQSEDKQTWETCQIDRRKPWRRVWLTGVQYFTGLVLAKCKMLHDIRILPSDFPSSVKEK